MTRPLAIGCTVFDSGNLPNPFLRVFSGQSLIAQNDNWQDTQQQEILLTHLDPCEPNPGQASSPPGCTQESAVLVTLPPGAYTAILSGVGGGTGLGLVEVFEVTPSSSIPNILSENIPAQLRSLNRIVRARQTTEPSARL